jgi:signal transduction histidine kinase
VLVFTHAGLSALFALAAIVALVIIDQEHHEATIKFDAARDARSISAAVAVVWDRPPLMISAASQQITESDGLQVVASNGTLLYTSGPRIPDSIADVAERQALSGSSGSELTSAASQSVVLAWAPVRLSSRTLGTITLMEPVSPGLAHTGDLAGVLALAVLAVVLAGLIGWLVGRWIAGPIEQLADSAYEGVVGSTSPPIPRRAVREAATLASTLSSSLERSEQGRLASVRQADQQRRLVQQVSHNLRTPLSVLALRLEQLEMLEDIGESNPERARVIARMKDQLGVLARQVDEVVSAEDLSGVISDLPEIDLAKVVSDRLPGLRALADHRGQRIVAHLEGGVRTRLAAGEMGAIVDELVVNAVKFAPERSLIGIAVQADPQSHSAMLVVSDEGPGIPVAERREVLKAHVRGENASGTPGSGLGLNLVSEILEVAHGSIHLRDVTNVANVAVGHAGTTGHTGNVSNVRTGDDADESPEVPNRANGKEASPHGSHRPHGLEVRVALPLAPLTGEPGTEAS